LLIRLKLQCHIVKNKLLQTAFSGILPTESNAAKAARDMENKTETDSEN